MMSRALTGAWAPTEMKLIRLCEAAGLSRLEAPALRLFRDMVKQCQLRNPRRAPRWSGLTDDSSPIEFSVVFTRRDCQLRLLFEPQADPQSPATYWSSGCRLTRYLARRWHAQIGSACAIEEFFRPTRNDVFLSMGHAVEPRAEGAPKCKVYFNAMARGSDDSRRVIGRALERLGLSRAWETLAGALTHHDRIELLALDLTVAPRVKLYVRPLGATLAHLQSLLAVSPEVPLQDIARTWERVHPTRSPAQSRPTFITYHLTPHADTPTRAVTSIPLFPGIRSDLSAAGRIRTLFEDLDLDSARYQACVRAMSDGPLSREQGIQSYIAVQSTPDDPTIVVYFNPRLYASQYGWLARNPTKIWSSPIGGGAKHR